MKINKLFLAAIAATVLLASCAKEQGTENANNGTQALVINLPNVVTRAQEAPIANNAPQPINNVVVYLMNGTVVVSAYGYLASAFDATAGYPQMRIENVSSNVNKVIVLANLPDYSTQATLDAYKALGNADAIRKYAFTTASQNVTGANAAAILDTKTLIGEGDVPTVTTADPANDGHTYKQMSVTLGALTARLEVGGVKAGEGIVDGSLSLVGTWVNNFYTNGSKSGVTFYSDTPTPIDYWATTSAAGVYATAAEINAAITNAYSNPEYYSNFTPALPATVCNAFHVFTGNVPHIIMLVKGEYATGYYNSTDDSDVATYNKKYFLGWVTFTKYDDGTIVYDGTTAAKSFAANTIYKMGLGADGIEIKAKYITPKPEPALIDLGINVTATPWSAVNVTPQPI